METILTLTHSILHSEKMSTEMFDILNGCHKTSLSGWRKNSPTFVTANETGIQNFFDDKTELKEVKSSVQG
jgi:hypothetical protein